MERTAQDIRREVEQVRDLLLAKNASYGDSVLSPLRVFSKADPLEQVNVRIDDKLSRIARGQGAETEDVVLDLLGYLILRRIMLARASESEARR